MWPCINEAQQHSNPTADITRQQTADSTQQKADSSIQQIAARHTARCVQTQIKPAVLSGSVGWLGDCTVHLAVAMTLVAHHKTNPSWPGTVWTPVYEAAVSRQQQDLSCQLSHARVTDSDTLWADRSGYCNSQP